MQVVIDNNCNTKNLVNLKNENESPKKTKQQQVGEAGEKGSHDREDAEKRNKVDREGDAVMVVWKDEMNKNQKQQQQPVSNNNREQAGPLELKVAGKLEVGEEPVSPSPRVGGRDAWSTDHEAGSLR